MEELAVFLIITAAALYLGRGILRKNRGENGGCGVCESNSGCATPDELPNRGKPWAV